MKSPIESSAGNFDDTEQSVRLAPQEAEQPLPETHVCDEASTLFDSSEVRRKDERNVFSDIFKGIAQEERETRAREEDGEVNQPFSSSRPPSTRGTHEVGEEVRSGVVVEEEKVNFMRSLNEWVARILSGLRDSLEPCMSNVRKESPLPSDEQSHPKKEQEDKVEMELVEEERAAKEKLWSKIEVELVRSKKVVSEPVEMQGSIPAEMGLEDQPLVSDD